MIDAAYLAAVSTLPHMTPARLSRLFAHFHHVPADIWRASLGQLREAGLPADTAQAILAARARVDPAAELARIERAGARIVPMYAHDYPAILHEVHNPPAVLYVRGTWPDTRDRHAVAVVGSRVTTPYGRQAAGELSRGLAQAGVTIVSGLAQGVDSIGHEAALAAGKRTVAVLGNGIDSVYPAHHRDLADKIVAQGGAVISEYGPGVEPAAYHFPQRNRIVAGLCRGVLVVEGREKSGSLITAQLALEAGREVFAVPGSIFADTSAGPNRLIAAGARPVLSAIDIIEQLGLDDLGAQQNLLEKLPEEPREARLYKLLTKESQHMDIITAGSELTASEVSATLSLLEMKGFAKNLGGNMWVRM